MVGAVAYKIYLTLHHRGHVEVGTHTKKPCSPCDQHISPLSPCLRGSGGMNIEYTGGVRRRSGCTWKSHACAMLRLSAYTGASCCTLPVSVFFLLALLHPLVGWRRSTRTSGVGCGWRGLDQNNHNAAPCAVVILRRRWLHGVVSSFCDT